MSRLSDRLAYRCQDCCRYLAFILKQLRENVVHFWRLLCFQITHSLFNIFPQHIYYSAGGLDGGWVGWGWGLPCGTLATRVSVQCFCPLASSGRSKMTVKLAIRLLCNTNQKLLLDSNWLKCLCELRSIAKAVFAVFDYTPAEMSLVMYNHR